MSDLTTSEEINTDATGVDATESPTEAAQEPANTPEAPEAVEAPEDATETPETFPRDYVEKLRKESAGYRDKAKRADDLAQRLHTALVEATGKLADARDLPFDEAHLDNPDALNGAIQSLLTDRPHLANRKPRGNVGQGATAAPDTVDLAGLLRARAS